MQIIRPLANLLRYGSKTLQPQIDPLVMRPIFEESFRQLTFYSPNDQLELRKTEKEDLQFDYSSHTKKFVQAGGTIYAQTPRKRFGPVDVISFINIDTFFSDSQGELFDAFSRIVKNANIERVVVCPRAIVWSSEDAEKLREMSGQRRFEHRRYQLRS